MNNILEVFSTYTDEQLFEIYKDILGSELIGIKAISLGKYADQVREICKFETKAQAIDFSEKLFYKEVTKRFFDKMK